MITCAILAFAFLLTANASGWFVRRRIPRRFRLARMIVTRSYFMNCHDDLVLSDRTFYGETGYFPSGER